MDCDVARLVGMLDAADPRDLLPALEQAVPRPSLCLAALHIAQQPARQKVRSRLESEVQFMHIFGARGGHVRLLRLTDHADDGVREARAHLSIVVLSAPFRGCLDTARSLPKPLRSARSNAC